MDYCLEKSQICIENDTSLQLWNSSENEFERLSTSMRFKFQTSGTRTSLLRSRSGRSHATQHEERCVTSAREIFLVLMLNLFVTFSLQISRSSN